jgi:hypothetical protein
VNWSISTGLNWWMWTSYHFHGELIPSKNVRFHRVPSGKRLHNYGKSHGKIHYKWAIFHSYFDITRG